MKRREKLLEKWLKNNIISSNALYSQGTEYQRPVFQQPGGTIILSASARSKIFTADADNHQSVECRVNCHTREGTTLFSAENLPQKLTLIYLDDACLSILFGIIVTANFTGLDKFRKKKLLHLHETTTETSVTYYFLNVIAF